MKPGEHPDFFRFPAPEGRSRESTIRLDAEGRFWHEGRLVEHERLAAALHGWIARHPDDGRFILTNGYDWTYFTVDDAPYVVRSVALREGAGVALRLSDGTEEDWDPEGTRIGEGGALYAPVKRSAAGGPMEAKFSRHAQTSLAPWLVDAADAGDARDANGAGAPAVRIGGQLHVIGAKTARFG